MEIFKLLESTMANVQPGHSMKHLRRDQLLDNYEAAARTLQTLMKAKESEIAHRKDLIKMLEDSKTYHDNRLAQAKQEYQTIKGHVPAGMDLKSIQIKPDPSERSTTPPMPPPSVVTAKAPLPLTQPLLPPPPPPPSSSSSSSTTSTVAPTPAQNTPVPVQSMPAGFQGQALSGNQDGGDAHDHNRSSLDRRLSEFLKTFPNLSQAGLAPPTSANEQQAGAKPTPGYYTQQPPLAAPMQISAPPSIELLRFPPPNMVNPAAMGQPPPMPPQMGFHHQVANHQENHESADMELSDHEDANVPPMIAAALQQGAGGKSYPDGQQQQFNNPSTVQQFAPRLNPLPFDPSIMEPGLRESHSPASTSSRDRHGDRSSSSRQRGSGGGSSSNHGSSGKSRYSSSSSTSSQSSSHRDKSRR